MTKCIPFRFGTLSHQTMNETMVRPVQMNLLWTAKYLFPHFLFLLITHVERWFTSNGKIAVNINSSCVARHIFLFCHICVSWKMQFLCLMKKHNAAHKALFTFWSPGSEKKVVWKAVLARKDFDTLLLCHTKNCNVGNKGTGIFGCGVPTHKFSCGVCVGKQSKGTTVVANYMLVAISSFFVRVSAMPKNKATTF